ncbi:hypothetical protein LguiA_034354 [Lonicera macranthoides]
MSRGPRPTWISLSVKKERANGSRKREGGKPKTKGLERIEFEVNGIEVEEEGEMKIMGLSRKG